MVNLSCVWFGRSYSDQVDELKAKCDKPFSVLEIYQSAKENCPLLGLVDQLFNTEGFPDWLMG